MKHKVIAIIVWACIPLGLEAPEAPAGIDKNPTESLHRLRRGVVLVTNSPKTLVTGTGLVVFSADDWALVLTAGHVLRDSHGNEYNNMYIRLPILSKDKRLVHDQSAYEKSNAHKAHVVREDTTNDLALLLVEDLPDSVILKQVRMQEDFSCRSTKESLFYLFGNHGHTENKQFDNQLWHFTVGTFDRCPERTQSMILNARVYGGY